MTAQCEWGMSWERIRKEWTWSYFRLMQRSWNDRVERLNAEASGSGEKRVSDTEMLTMLGI